MALFLVVVGVTGSVIAYYGELDRLLNPELYKIAPRGEDALSPLELRELAKAYAPGAAANYLNLLVKPDEAAVFYLEPRINSETGGYHELDFDEIFLDPYNGSVVGKRDSGEGVLPFIYTLHYSLALPEPWGRLLLGFTALIWALDCFVGFYLTLPRGRRRFWKRWKRTWGVTWNYSPFRINFDLHRAAGLWTWGALLVFAVSSVQFNLYDEIFTPALKTLLPFKNAYESIPVLPESLEEPKITWEEALDRGRTLMSRYAAQEGFVIEREFGVSLDRLRGVFVYSAISSLDIRDDSGDTRVFLSAVDGSDLGLAHPYVAAGNAVSQWLASLHTARVWGTPYRVFVSVMGIVVAALSVTGVVIWWKKRSYRSRIKKRST
jgi:uncharacterized iron-regulated membrane protein